MPRPKSAGFRRLQPGETGRELTRWERERVVAENATRAAGVRRLAALDRLAAEGKALRGAPDLAEVGLVRP